MQKILVVCPDLRDYRELDSLKHRFTFIYHEYSSEKLEKLIYEEGHEEGRSDPIIEIIEKMIVDFRDEGISGIISSDDYPGSIIASVVAEALNLPAPSPKSVLTCQHKYYSRIAQKKFVPEAVPNFSIVFPQKGISMPFPFFLKPVKSYFSCFAYPVSTQKDLNSLIHALPPLEFLEPFNQLLKHYTDFEHDANCWVAEDLLTGFQATIEGYIHEGEPFFLGVIDSIMYPETISFKRFEYPSSLPLGVQERMFTIAATCMKGMGFDNGIFNIEFFYHPQNDTLHIIEINPRIASQFADLYEKVDGMNSFEILLALATGQKPIVKRQSGNFKCAASCVLREFENKLVKKVPSESTIVSLKNIFPEARIQICAKEGKKLSNELQDGKSYRYGLIHLGAKNWDELQKKLEHCMGQLDFQFQPLL